MLPVLFTSSSAYEIAKSLRFRASANPLLSRTGVAGDPKKATISAWVKLGRIGGVEQIFEAWSTASRLSGLTIAAAGDIYFQHIDGTRNISWRPTNLFRDPGAWFHIVMQMDFTQASVANAVRMFLNGVEVAVTQTVHSGSYAQNMNSYFNTAVSHRHGLHNNTTYTDGYRAELHFLDGVLAGPEEFGKTDPVTGQWVPIKYKGAYGTNGHYLDFSDGSSTTTLGYDKSGNGRNFTVSGISLTAGETYDWVDDTPSNNFAVLSELIVSEDREATFSEAALKVTQNTSTVGPVSSFSSIALHATAKIYVEATAVSGITSAASGLAQFGVSGLTASTGVEDVARYVSDGRKAVDNTLSAYGAAYSSGDVIGMTVDVATKTVEFFKNNVSQGTLTWTGNYPTLLISPSANGRTAGNRVWAVNFGQRPFAYTPPTGFKALCTKNLPAPQVKNGAAYFDVVLDSGANIKTASEALFGNFFEWIKDRANTNNHQLIDSVRGSSAVLQSNTTAAETTYSAPSGSSVGWVWRIAAGFLDVVTYTGTGVARTVAHNLGVAPAMVMVTSRTLAGTAWHVYHTSLGALKRVFLEQTNAESVSPASWNDTAPTSSELTVGAGGGVNTSGEEYVAYLFAEVPGFSKFGSYVGNGSADGPFVYCGFKPKYVLLKNATTAGTNWFVLDAERNTYNLVNTSLLPNSSGAEIINNLYSADFTSNGFKIRSTDVQVNQSTANIVFAAFAECPFKYATAR